MPEFTTLVSGLSFAECPRWRDGRLYVSDFYTHRVLAFAMDGTLFACVAPTFHEAQASANHHAAILTTKVAVPHAGLP